MTITVDDDHRPAGRRRGGGARARRRHRGGAQVAPARRHPAAPLAGADRRHRPGAGRHPRRAAAGDRTAMPDPTSPPAGATAALVLADGAVFWGRGFGATRRGRARRRGLLQHRHDRLSGDADRPVLCRADHHLHLPAYRQCRRQRRGYRGDHDRRARPGGEAGHHRAVQLARRPGARCLAAGAGRRRARRRRHAGADRAHPRRRRAQRRAGLSRRRPLRHPGPGRPAPRAWPGLEGMDLAQRGLLHAELRLGRDGMGLARRATGGRPRRAITSSRSITAPSATSCAASPPPAAA